jgi:stage IV sporulation protein FB
MPKINISILTVLILPLVLLDPTGEIAATIIAAFIHELGHIAVILMLGIGIRAVGVTPYGLEITTVRKYRSFVEELAVSCAGCIFNFICYFILMRLGTFSALAYSSLILGILNALPVLTLDGGEALRALLSILFSYRTAEKTSRFISLVTLVMTWSFAAYIFLFSGYNYSLFIMTVWLFGKIYCGK